MNRSPTSSMDWTQAQIKSIWQRLENESNGFLSRFQRLDETKTTTIAVLHREGWISAQLAKASGTFGVDLSMSGWREASPMQQLVVFCRHSFTTQSGERGCSMSFDPEAKLVRKPPEKAFWSRHLMRDRNLIIYNLDIPSDKYLLNFAVWSDSFKSTLIKSLAKCLVLG